MSARKLDWMKFYPADWLADNALKGCSIAAQGLWIKLVCLMHESPLYGVLLRENGTEYDHKSVKIVIGLRFDHYQKLVAELEENGVLSRRESDGVIYSRRMVRDAEKRQTNAENGKKGGNPKLKQNKHDPAEAGKPGAYPPGLSDGLTPPDKGEDKAKRLEARVQEARTAIVETDWFDFLEEACMTAGMPPGRAANSTGLIAPWSKLGLSQTQILKIIADAAKRPGYQPPRSLGYFTNQLTDAGKAIAGAAPLPAGKRPQTEAEKLTQLAINRDSAVKFHRRNPDMWPSGFGPPPDHPDCLASLDVLIEHGFRKPRTEAAQ